MTYDNVFFDFDGTLVDSAPAILKTFRAILEAAGVESRCAIDSRLIGPPLGATLKVLAGDDESLVERLSVDFKRCYDESTYRDTLPYSGIPEVLATLHGRGAALVIVTNKRRTPTLRILEHLGWSHYFLGVETSDTQPPGRSGKAAMLAEALARRRATADRSIMIGDTLEDRDGALANGVAFGAALWGYGGLADRVPPPECLSSPAGILARLNLESRA